MSKKKVSKKKVAKKTTVKTEVKAVDPCCDNCLHGYKGMSISVECRRYPSIQRVASIYKCGEYKVK